MEGSRRLSTLLDPRKAAVAGRQPVRGDYPQYHGSRNVRNTLVPTG